MGAMLNCDAGPGDGARPGSDQRLQSRSCPMLVKRCQRGPVGGDETLVLSERAEHVAVGDEGVGIRALTPGELRQAIPKPVDDLDRLAPLTDAPPLPPPPPAPPPHTP